jgi:protein-disulfide isomerase
VTAVVAIFLGVALSRGGTTAAPIDVPRTGSHSRADALPGAAEVYSLFRGIPQSGLVLGEPKAPATLTEFIDLQCPNCQVFEDTQLPTLVRRYVRPGKLSIRLEPWSILSPPDSPRGQAATIAASLQDRAFQFAALLYLNQRPEGSGWLTDGMIGSAAASIDSLKPRQVLGDLDSPPVSALVSRVDRVASAYDLDATPTILLNRRGQTPRVVSVGVPELATRESQINATIGK